MRKKKALLNLVSSFAMQMVLVISNFIIPRLIITNYGSSINGLINSLTLFLNYISLLEAGVSPVIQAGYYKALANGDTYTQSQIYKESRKFFNTIGYISVGYLAILILVYPAVAKTELPKSTIVILLLIISITTFSQYFFGITNQCIIQADQSIYVVNGIKMFANILNVALVASLAYMHASIFMVKGASAFVLSLIPVSLLIYTKKYYKIDKKIPRNKNVLKDKWSGLGLHIASFIHGNTDVFLLTIFSGMLEVSVYSVYFLVISGLRSLEGSFTNSVIAAFGNMIAKNEKERLRKSYLAFDHLHLIIVFAMFTIAYYMIIPFVRLYTNGVTEVEYIRPVYAGILLLGEAIYSQRCSYSCIVSAAGHFKQTMRNCFVEAFLNVMISLALVGKYGLVGVGIGTLVAMTYRLVDYIFYLSKNIVYLNPAHILYRIVVNIGAFITIFFSLKWIDYGSVNSIGEWIFYAVITAIITVIELIVFNLIFCNKQMKDVYSILVSPYMNKLINKIKEKKL